MWSPPAPENCSIVVRLCVPATQRYVARNRNCPRSGWLRTAPIVPKRFGTSTPLRGVRSVVVLVMAFSFVGCLLDTTHDAGSGPSGLGDDLESIWRSSEGGSHHGRVIFEFDEFEIDTVRFELRSSGEVRHVEPQVFDVLRYLVENRDRVVTKEELLDNVWGDRFVSESALTSRIKAARQAVGDTGRAQRVISTAHGRGYRFVAEVVAQEATPPSTVRAETNLPQLVDQFVGRGDDMQRLVDAVAGSRIVTLVGPGGVGKTRLAIEYARTAERDTTFVDLSRVNDGGAVARTFLDTLAVSPRSNVADCDRLAEALETRSLLIIVDNCEQVVDAVAEVLGRIERDAAGVSIVSTSRQSLNVSGEYVVVVEPLALPDESAPPSEQQASEAVQLFCERARRAG